MAKTAYEVNETKRTLSASDNGFAASPCEAQLEDFEVLLGELRDSVGGYLKKRPLVSSGLVFLVGFYLGWKTKPW